MLNGNGIVTFHTLAFLVLMKIPFYGVRRWGKPPLTCNFEDTDRIVANIHSVYRKLCGQHF